MMIVIGSLVVLFAIALIKKTPFVGGNIPAALVGGGLAAALLSGMAPIDYLTATVDGLDKLAWVIALSIFGSIYAETQVRIGAMTTTMQFLQLVFGKSPRGLIAATFVTLTLAGSLLGDAIAAATVIGFLVIHALAQMKLSPVQIGMIILLGASLGSLMPPISQAVYLSASLVDTNPDPVTLISYITVTIGLVLAIVESFRFVSRRRLERLETSEDVLFSGHDGGALTEKREGSRVSQLRSLIRKRWASMMPLAVLVVIVLLRTALGFDVFAEIPGVREMTAWMATVPILNGIAFPVVLAIIVATVVALFYPAVRSAPAATISAGLKNVRQTVVIQLCAAFLVGCFYASGAVDTVARLAENVASSGVAVISTIALMVLGMLVGSQTTAQTIVVPFAAPILENAGVDPTNIAVGMSHIAAASQNLPPVGLTAFVICGLVGATLKTKVDPIKVMVLALPNSLYFIFLGLLFLLLS